MAAFPYILLLVVLCCYAASADRPQAENEATTKAKRFEGKLMKLESEIRGYPSSNTTADRLERLEVLVNLLLEDVYDVRVDQEILKRDIMGRLKEIEDKIRGLQPPAAPPTAWMHLMMADFYKDFRPFKNYTDDDIPKVHKDCKEAYDRGWTKSGVYRIAPDNQNEMDVFCQQDELDGGWTVIQRRVDGSVNFGRGWAAYRDGFGDVSGEFWIGNQNLHALTAGRDTRLRVQLQYTTDGFTDVQYQEFYVEGESENYQLHVSNFTGSDVAGDSLSYHDGQSFSTVDADHDHSHGSCAAVHGGGWWYDECTKANLNGVYTSQAQNGIFWKTWTGYSNSLKSVTMMVKGDDSHVIGSYVNGELRLVHPTGEKNEGRLEIMLNDMWGSVCDNSFDNIDAMVSCRQMGYGNGTYKTTKLPGTGPIWLDEVNCSPDHTRLLDCPHHSTGDHNCSHGHDVYIRCLDSTQDNVSYVDGDLRLVHPSGSNMFGRLEIILNETWGSICGHYFDNVDAMVACRQLGFADGAYLPSISLPGTGPIWLDELRCSSRHQRLLDCPHYAFDIGVHSCSHLEDAYITCLNSPQDNGSYINGDLRLVHPNGTKTQGRLEIRLNNAWGNICDGNHRFSHTQATVACKQMGFTYGMALETTLPGTGPTWLDEVFCSSTDTRLLDCRHSGIGDVRCDSRGPHVYIACYKSDSCPDLRLVNPTGSRTDGRLEILLNGTWGSVCEDYFYDTDAMVACRQLGFSDGVVVRYKQLPGTGPIWLEAPFCTSSHRCLLDCPHNGIGNVRCRHSDDVYITCNDGPSKGICSGVRLVGGSCPGEGRLEIYHDNTWGTICNHGFGAEEAAVACRELGYHSGVPMKAPSPGAGTIWLDKLSCSPTHTSIEDCKTTDWGRHTCTHQQDTGVVCFSTP